MWDSALKFAKMVAATVVSLGSASAGDLVALDDNGKLDPSVLPSSGGSSATTATSSESLNAGDYVNLYNNSGTLTVRKALAQDTTKPVMGFVRQSYSSGATASIYADGDNDAIPLGTFAASDIGKMLFLSPTTAGAVTTTPPSTAGQLIQPLGRIKAVNTGSSIVTADFDLGMEIIAG